MGCGSVFLECNTTLLNCCIEPRNQLLLQHAQIQMLANFSPIFYEDEWNFFTCCGYTSTNNDRRRFFGAYKQYARSAGYLLCSLLLHKSDRFDDCISPELLITFRLYTALEDACHSSDHPKEAMLDSMFYLLRSVTAHFSKGDRFKSIFSTVCIVS